jgi:4-phosphopantoate---beta-alanine ligase
MVFLGCMQGIPPSHPRYQSLVLRERLARAVREGIAHETGLIAHGRGEAFDYLLGETTIPLARAAEEAATAAVLCAKHPVLSVNGNVAALAAEECVALARAVPLKLEVNLFHRTGERARKVAEVLKAAGAETVLGVHPTARIPGLESDRGLCEQEGIFSADVVVVPLEDGDRAEALRLMGKTVVAVDLNPLSRTARAGSITIVDNVIRALPVMVECVSGLRRLSRGEIEALRDGWDNETCLSEVLSFLSKRLESMYSL